MFTKIAIAMIGAALILYLLGKISNALCNSREKAPQED